MTTAEFLNRFLTYTLESSIMLIVFYLLYYLLLRKETNFEFIRYYLLLTPILAVVLPFLSLPVLYPGTPSYQPVLNLTLPQVEVASMVSREFIEKGPALSGIFIAYAIILIIFAISFARQLFILWKLRHSKTKTYWKGYPVVATEGKYPTFSFLGCIFYDNTSPVSEEEKQLILLHESVHLIDYHSVDILISKMISIIFWYNPLLMLFLSATKLNHEYLADAKVLATSGVAKSTYKKSLAMNSLRASSLSIATFFNVSQTLNRIKMMNLTSQPIKLHKVLTLALITCCLAFAFSCESNEEKPNDLAVAPVVADSPVTNSAVTNSEPDPSEELFTVVEEQPDFQGGGNTVFMDYISRNLRFPEKLIEDKVEGTVYVQFIVEKDGSVENVEVLKGIHAIADEEAAKAVRSSPKWTPGKHGGKPVRVRMIIPISFKLG